MQIEVPDASQALQADGGSDGYATVIDNSKYFVGCEAWINDTDGSQRCIITDLSGSTKVGLRFIPEDNEQDAPRYGIKSDLSAFTVAKSSRLNMPRQLAKIERDWIRPLVGV